MRCVEGVGDSIFRLPLFSRDSLLSATPSMRSPYGSTQRPPMHLSTDLYAFAHPIKLLAHLSYPTSSRLTVNILACIFYCIHISMQIRKSCTVRVADSTHGRLPISKNCTVPCTDPCATFEFACVHRPYEAKVAYSRGSTGRSGGPSATERTGGESTMANRYRLTFRRTAAYSCSRSRYKERRAPARERKSLEWPGCITYRAVLPIRPTAMFNSP